MRDGRRGNRHRGSIAGNGCRRFTARANDNRRDAFCNGVAGHGGFWHKDRCLCLTAHGCLCSGRTVRGFAIG
jgi:hypothetical protein